MARIEFDVTNEDGEKTRVVAGQADVIAMERKYDVSASTLGTNPRIEWIAFLAWNAARRLKQTDLDFDTWIEKFEVGEAEAPKED